MGDEFMEAYQQRIEQELELEKTRNIQSMNEMGKISAYSVGNEKDLANIQTDVEMELDRIYHLLSGHKSVKVGEEEKWIEPKDDKNKIFSEYGVEQIMNSLSFYISKVHILSYYPEYEQIKQMTYDFGMKLADLIHNKCEWFFYYPKPEELYKKLYPLIENNKKDFLSYIIVKDGEEVIDEEALYKECVKLSEQELKNKLAHFPMIHLELVHSVHSSLMKAYKGETARNLRTMAHIHQSISSGMQQQPQKSFSVAKPSTWRNS